MALAARSSADPRTACPVCGGSIHPIAGKCKHCKTDLVKLRRQQQQAAGTPAPARMPYGGATAPRPATVQPVPSNGAAHPAPSAAPQPVIISAPVPAVDPYVVPLPPPRGAWSRSWPIVVAVIAAAAIVVSVILLLTGGNKDHDSKTDRVIPPPAPDRMNTDPLPSDPWQGATPGGSAGSGSSSGNTYPAQPAPPVPAQPAPPTPPSPTPQTGATAPAAEQFNGAMWQTVCERFSSCGVLDPSGKQLCDDLSKAAQYSDTDTRDRVAKGECTYDRDKAATCLNALGGLPCAQAQADLGALSKTILDARECMDVLTCH